MNERSADTVASLASYVRGIRNAKKRGYAESYVAWRLGKGSEPEFAESGLSYMGAQAVRLAVAALIAGDV